VDWRPGVFQQNRPLTDIPITQLDVRWHQLKSNVVCLARACQSIANVGQKAGRSRGRLAISLIEKFDNRDLPQQVFTCMQRLGILLAAILKNLASPSRK